MEFQEQVIKKTDQELLDIYINSDEYQEKFIAIVTQELIKRNITLEKYQQEKEYKSNLSKEILETGKKGNELYIFLGFIAAILGGIIGIITGYIYSQSKKVSNSGEKYHAYNKETRDKGRVMMIIGIFSVLIISIWRLS